MSTLGLDNLVLIDGIVNHELYLNTKKSNLKLSAQNLDIVETTSNSQENFKLEQEDTTKQICELKSAITEEYRNIDVEIAKRRLKDVEANGYLTKY
ncbi:hypothetical protein TNCV_2557051 [Trichonephila clavipes]|nr:hypothetical protein TNCV_2557051 [Trichonephila clavipes]